MESRFDLSCSLDKLSDRFPDRCYFRLDDSGNSFNDSGNSFNDFGTDFNHFIM